MPSSLFIKNQQAFAQQFPALAQKIAAMPAPKTRLLVENAEAINIEVGPQKLYPAPAKPWAKHQLEDYLKDPDRFVFRDPGHCNISPVTYDTMEELRAYLKKNDLSEISAAPVIDAGFVFVFGLGLGFHIQEIVEKQLAQNIVIIEPFEEFLLHSLNAVDWAQMFEAAQEKGMAFHWILGASPAQTVEEMHNIIERVGNIFLDGSHALHHYMSQELLNARQEFNRGLKLHSFTKSFFEDEVVMVKNAYQNYRDSSFYFVGPKANRIDSYPAIIVGSGPSLDNDLEKLKELSQKAIVFSCGTALGILLKNGIRPHFHVESENSAPLVYTLEKMGKTYDLEGIRLLSSSTVNPRLTAMFDEAWHYIRYENCSSVKLLTPKGENLPYATPLVSNAAVSAALSMGFGPVCLFGIDCGSPVDGKHHAADAPYYEEDYNDQQAIDMLEGQKYYQVPGNFGGVMQTTELWDYSRHSFERLARLHEAELVNCSDGVLIEGARPTRSQDLSFGEEARAPEDVLEELHAQGLKINPGEFNPEQADFEQALKSCDSFECQWQQMFAGFDPLPTTYHQIDGAYQQLYCDQNRYPLALMYGTLNGLMRLGAFYGTRIEDETARQAFMKEFLVRFKDRGEVMLARAKTLFQAFVEGERDLPLVEALDDEGFFGVYREGGGG